MTGIEGEWRAGRARRSILVARVDPARVSDNYLRRTLLERTRFFGASLGLPWYRRRGAWDLRCRPFHEHPTYRFLQQYYGSGFDPTVTDRYHEMMQRSRREHGDDASERSEPDEAIHRYFERRRALFDSMAQEGYRAGMARDEIGLAIARDGRLIKTANGNHRMAVAQLLGLESVSMELRFVHERWYWQCVPQSGGDFRVRLATAVRELPGVLETSHA